MSIRPSSLNSPDKVCDGTSLEKLTLSLKPGKSHSACFKYIFNVCQTRFRTYLLDFGTPCIG